jgi:hypothetical protein
MASSTTNGLNMTDMPVPTTMAEQPSYKGVVYQSFSPLCGPCGTTELIDGPIVTAMGKKHVNGVLLTSAPFFARDI